MISALSSLRERFPSCSLAWTGWASSKLVGLVAKSFSAPVTSEAELLFQEAASCKVKELPKHRCGLHHWITKFYD